MLTLLPLSGLQTALKRRNSKTMDFGRRDSISVYATYSLPTSKSSLRRFSSYDELAPIFQHLLADEGKATKRAESPLVEVATTAGTTSSEQKPSKLRTLSLRRGSISFGKNKTPSFTAKSETSCADLDAQLTKIKSQLAEFKNEDLDISQRVDDLSSSVEDLCRDHLTQCSKPDVTSRFGLAELRRHSIAIAPCPTRGKVWRRTGSAKPTISTHSSLEVVHEASKVVEEEDGEDEQSFEDYCKRTLPKIGQRHSNPKLDSTSFPELDSLPDPKAHCVPNNLLVPAKSVPVQLNLVRNDLSRHDRSFTRSQRLSVLSCHSDSVIFTNRARPPISPLCLEHSMVF